MQYNLNKIVTKKGLLQKYPEPFCDTQLLLKINGKLATFCGFQYSHLLKGIHSLFNAYLRDNIPFQKCDFD